MKGRNWVTIISLCVAIFVSACGNTVEISTEAGGASTVPDVSIEETVQADEKTVDFPTEDGEIRRAVKLGIGEIPDADRPVTFAEFSLMLERVIAAVDRTKVEQWQTVMEKAYASEEEMERREGMVALYMAAELLGDQYIEQRINVSANELVAERVYKEDTQIWDDMGNGNYQYFPDVWQNPLYDKDVYYVDGAVHYCVGHYSWLSGQLPFDFDEEAGTMHVTEPLLYSEAMRAALRMKDTNPIMPVQAEEQSGEELELLTAINTRREQILNSETDIEVKGTVYYVSNDGDDRNDGLSSETPWASVEKVNETPLKEGDGVLFKRGDLWRSMVRKLDAGITYSAYGEGAKPAFYGSVENGGGAEKWSLVEGTDNIWKFHRALPFAGTISLGNDEVLARLHWTYWNGTEYTEYGTDDVPVDMTQMEDMTFFSCVDLSEYTKNPDNYTMYGNLQTYDCYETGPLYLRCDAGNPGALYDSIEFVLGDGMMVGENCVIDNLCVKYTGDIAISNDILCIDGYTVQNCEIGHIGDAYMQFDAETMTGVGGGECFGLNGYGNVLKNNYVHDGREGSGTIELGWNGELYEGQMKMGGLVVEGNLFERNNGGFGIFSFFDEEGKGVTISDIVFKDNYFSEIGYTEAEQIISSDVPHSCLSIYFGSKDINVQNMQVIGNLFYRTMSDLLRLSRIGESTINFEGNTYAQAAEQRVLYYEAYDQMGRLYGAVSEEAFEKAVRVVLKDKTGRILRLNVQ